MQNEDFVSFEQAVKLYNFDFDWGCDMAYCVHSRMKEPRLVHFTIAYREQRNYDGTDVYSAPSQSQAQKWLREVKGIDICVWRSFSVSHGYHYQIVKDNDWENSDVQVVCDGRSYEQSLSDAIDEALELIEKKK